MFKFDLGQKVRDKITGFAGVIVGRAQYLTGCLKYALQAEALDKDGKPLGWEWLDEGMLEVMACAADVKIKSDVGGPEQLPPSR